MSSITDDDWLTFQRALLELLKEHGVENYSLNFLYTTPTGETQAPHIVHLDEDEGLGIDQVRVSAVLAEQVVGGVLDTLRHYNGLDAVQAGGATHGMIELAVREKMLEAREAQAMVRAFIHAADA
jgi:hypothetical protein